MNELLAALLGGLSQQQGWGYGQYGQAAGPAGGAAFGPFGAAAGGALGAFLGGNTSGPAAPHRGAGTPYRPGPRPVMPNPVNFPNSYTAPAFSSGGQPQGGGMGGDQGGDQGGGYGGPRRLTMTPPPRPGAFGVSPGPLQGVGRPVNAAMPRPGVAGGFGMMLDPNNPQHAAMMAAARQRWFQQNPGSTSGGQLGGATGGNSPAFRPGMMPGQGPLPPRLGGGRPIG